MKSNVNDIIGLVFTTQMPSSDPPQASVMITDLLEQAWGGRPTEGVAATEMNDTNNPAIPAQVQT